MCLMDMEFKKLEDNCTEVLVNTTAAREYVGDIERCIRTIKDRCRSVVSELPYKQCMPDIFIVYLLKFIVLWMNAFPSSSGVSTELLSSRTELPPNDTCSNIEMKTRYIITIIITTILVILTSTVGSVYRGSHNKIFTN